MKKTLNNLRYVEFIEPVAIPKEVSSPNGAKDAKASWILERTTKVVLYREPQVYTKECKPKIYKE